MRKFTVIWPALLVFVVSGIYSQSRTNKSLPVFVESGAFKNFVYWVNDDLGQWKSYLGGYSGYRYQYYSTPYAEGIYNQLEAITVNDVTYGNKSYVLYDVEASYDTYVYWSIKTDPRSMTYHDFYLFDKTPEFNIKTDVPTALTLQAVSSKSQNYENSDEAKALLVTGTFTPDALTFTVLYDSETDVIRFAVTHGTVGKQPLDNNYFETSKELFFSVFGGTLDGKKVELPAVIGPYLVKGFPSGSDICFTIPGATVSFPSYGYDISVNSSLAYTEASFDGGKTFKAGDNYSNSVSFGLPWYPYSKPWGEVKNLTFILKKKDRTLIDVFANANWHLVE
jgi:hypothetical protein